MVRQFDGYVDRVENNTAVVVVDRLKREYLIHNSFGQLHEGEWVTVSVNDDYEFRKVARNPELTAARKGTIRKTMRKVKEKARSNFKIG